MTGSELVERADSEIARKQIKTAIAKLDKAQRQLMAAASHLAHTSDEVANRLVDDQISQIDTMIARLEEV